MELKSVIDPGKDLHDITIKVKASFSISRSGLGLKAAIEDTMDLYKKMIRNPEWNGRSFDIEALSGIQINGIDLPEEEVKAILSGDFSTTIKENSESNTTEKRVKVLGISYYEIFNLIHCGWSSIETGNDDGSVMEFLAIVEGTETKPKFIHPGTPIISTTRAGVSFLGA
jgi:hypothetical protein